MIALAADRLTAERDAAARMRVTATPDVAPFVLPVAGDSARGQEAIALASDPFGDARRAAWDAAVASGATSPTVPSAQPRGPRLTAILVADERRVAVIDEETVTVGATLRDGARVAAILPDRVWIAEKDGRRHMLTLTTRGQ